MWIRIVKNTYYFRSIPKTAIKVSINNTILSKAIRFNYNGRGYLAYSHEYVKIRSNKINRVLYNVD